MLGLLCSEAASLIGTDEKSLMFWEREARTPLVSAYPAIIQYLGYEPWPEPVTLGQALLAARRKRGVEIRKAAVIVGADEGTWRRWERAEWKPTRRMLPVIDRFLGYSVAQRFPDDVR